MDGIKCNTHTCTITYYARDVNVLRNWCLKFEMSNCNGPHLEFFAVHSKKALVYLCYWHWSVLWNYLCNIGSSFVFFKLLNYTDVSRTLFHIWYRRAIKWFMCPCLYFSLLMSQSLKLLRFFATRSNIVNNCESLKPGTQRSELFREDTFYCTRTSV